MSQSQKRTPRPDPTGATQPAPAGIPDSTAYTLLFLVSAAALFLRLHNLVQAPPGLWTDEAVNGIDAMTSLRTGHFRIFYPDNFGREGLFVWLQAVSVGVFGNTVPALRIPSAVIGTLTVPLMFFTTRRLFAFFGRGARTGTVLDPNAVGLLAAAFLAASHWHVNFSRVAFRGILDPLFGLAAVCTMIGLLEKPSYKTAAVAGAVTGLGLYAYSSFRFIVFPLLFLVAYDAWRQRGLAGAPAKILTDKALWTFVLVVVLLAAPLLHVALEDPERFFRRSKMVSVLEEDDPAREFRLSLTKALGQFHIEGDGNWRHNHAGKPALPAPLGICFLLALLAGPAWLLQRASAVRESRAGRCVRDYTVPALWLLLFLWLVSGLMPAALTHDGRPHFLRSISSIPPVYILTAVGCFGCIHLLGRILPRQIAGWVVLILAFLAPVYAFHSTWNSYFQVWATDYWTGDYFMNDLTRISHRAANLPDTAEKLVVVGFKTHPKMHREWFLPPFTYLTHTETEAARTAKNYRYVGLDALEKLPPTDRERYLILYLRTQEDRDKVAAAAAGVAPDAIIVR